jgi:hypothetical protein
LRDEAARCAASDIARGRGGSACLTSIAAALRSQRCSRRLVTAAASGGTAGNIGHVGSGDARNRGAAGYRAGWLTGRRSARDRGLTAAITAAATGAGDDLRRARVERHRALAGRGSAAWGIAAAARDGGA